METFTLIAILILLLSAPYATFMIAKAKYQSKSDYKPEEVDYYDNDEFTPNLY